MKTIALESLTIMLLPLLAVAGLYWKWLGKAKEIPLATLRMVSQLLLIGYILTWLFQQSRIDVALVILVFMMLISSLIALRNHTRKSKRNYLRILTSIALGGSFNLLLVVALVIRPDPIYSLSTLIPLAGMIYSNGMNSVSLAGERFWKQVDTGSNYENARNEAFHMSLIPQMNSFLAVGLVSLPGMMTGQVLSGVSPLIAVRYQIMVMSMIMGTAGISVAIYLILCKKEAVQELQSSHE